MHYFLIALSYSCAAAVKRAKGTRFLSALCTIQGQGGCPWESHLISSSLHVINLPVQCYCSTGHSSSFREKSIDQTSLGNAFMCVVSGKRKTEKKPCPIYISFIWSVFSAYTYRYASSSSTILNIFCGMIILYYPHELNKLLPGAGKS